MYLYIERWRARPAWLALSISNRIAYLDRMGTAVQEFTQTGVRLLGVALRGEDAPNPPGEWYVAAWAMPGGAAQGRQLEDILAAAGWHHYFAPMGDQEASPATRSFFDYTPSSAPMGTGTVLAPRRN